MRGRRRGRKCTWVICGSVLVVVGGRNCAIIVQPTLEEWLEVGCMDMVGVVNPNKSWEGEWYEHSGGRRKGFLTIKEGRNAQC